MSHDHWTPRLLAFLEDPTADDLDRLSLDAYRLQYESIPAIAQLASTHGVTPDSITSWRQIPTVPTLAFKTQKLHLAEPSETFRSSGTSSSGTSTHYHPFPDLYRAIIDHSFPAAFLGSLSAPPMLSLIPDRETTPESSLAFMVDHIMSHFGREDSSYAVGPRGVKLPVARSWLGARQRDRCPAVILTTSLALHQLLDSLEKRFLHFRLAPGSLLFETGGLKGRDTEVTAADQMARITAFLGLGPEAIVREYGMTELTSQAYADRSSGGGYRLPHWARVRALEPETLQEQPHGESGLLAFLDLGNVGSALHVLTEDLGSTVDDRTFFLEGRASESELRGCSLTAEELAVT